MRIYISHPIAGKTEKEKCDSEDQGVNYAQFKLNMYPVLPRGIAAACDSGYGDQSNGGCGIPGRTIPGDDHTVQCYMRGDILELLTCDAILMMPGWEQSSGCRDEINVAAMCGIPVYFYEAGN